MAIKLLIVEDHPIVRLGIKMLFENMEDVFIVGEASSVSEVQSLKHSIHPDVVLLDTELPGGTGLKCLTQIKKLYPESAVIALSFCDDHIYREEMLSSGVRSIVSKRAASRDLVDTVRTIARATPA